MRPGLAISYMTLSKSSGLSEPVFMIVKEQQCGGQNNAPSEMSVSSSWDLTDVIPGKLVEMGDDPAGPV